MEHFAKNPVFNGWCSDPSILRVGEDYYIAASTFEWMPGVNIFHSRDLCHWEQLPSPLTDEFLNQEGMEPSCGIWAPNLTWCEGLFYLAYTIVYTNAHRFKDTHNFIVTARDIRGPWSKPVFINCIGFDPSIFHDDDGKKYIVNQTMERRKAYNRFRGVSVTALDPVTLRPLGLSKVVFAGTERGTTEGPNILKRNGWYYITMAEGGTEFGHCVTMARSRCLWGPYEVDPDNPMLTSTGTDCELQRAGHGQYVTDPQGNWYMAHLCSRPFEGKYSILGRECAIQNIVWTEKGWPRISDANGNILPHATPQLQFHLPDAVPCVYPERPVRTVFAKGIAPEWMSLRRGWANCGISLLEREGWMRIHGGNALCSHFHQHLLAKRVTSTNFEAATEMEFRAECANHTAGMVVLYNSSNWHYCFISADDNGKPTAGVSTCENGELTDRCELALPEACGNYTIYATLEGADLHFFFKCDEGEKDMIGPALDMRILSDESVSGNGFTSAMIGVCCQDLQGNGCAADFRWFDYKDR